jgi:predicted NAD/FAD-dependent oxidoreductase
MHTGNRVSPGDSAKNKIDRYAYAAGNNTFGKLLASGLDVRFESHVALFQKAGKGYELNGETFDGLILTPPAPQTDALLIASGERRPLAQASYRPCLSVLLGYELAPPTSAYHALIEPEQRHPLTWISLESVKAPGRAPEGCTAIVAQLSPAYSRQHYESQDHDIVHDTADFLARIFGAAWMNPAIKDVKRWKYSLPESLALFESVNPPKSRLVIAGDALLGGRVEYAYETGIWAARMFIEE